MGGKSSSEIWIGLFVDMAGYGRSWEMMWEDVPLSERSGGFCAWTCVYICIVMVQYHWAALCNILYPARGYQYSLLLSWSITLQKFSRLENMTRKK